MKKEHSILGLLVVLLLCFVGIMIWFGQSVGYNHFLKSNEKPVKSDTCSIPTQFKTVTLKKSFSGMVLPANAVDILPHINGFIDKVLVQKGQKVTAGETLFIIQQRQYLAQKEVAEANVTAAQSTLNNAQIHLGRLERAQTNAVTETEIENARLAFLTAQSHLKSARSQLRLAEINYDYTLVQTPIGGIVDNVAVIKGNYVSPAGNPLAKIMPQSPVRVVFAIKNREYASLLFDDKSPFENVMFRLQMPNGQIYPFTGKFQSMTRQGVSPTSDIWVYVDFENPDNQLFVNGYVTVMIEKTIKKAVRFNMDYTCSNDDVSYVYNDYKVAQLSSKHTHPIGIFHCNDTSGKETIVCFTATVLNGIRDLIFNNKRMRRYKTTVQQ